MTKKILLLLILVPFFSFGQTNYFIKGTVVDEDNEPLTGASIKILETTIGSSSDKEGKFKLKNLSNGSYSIEVSFVGYLNERINVSINNQSMI